MMTKTKELARSAKLILDTVARAAEGFYIHIDAGMLVCSDPDYLQNCPGAVDGLHALITDIPGTGLPIAYHKEKNGDVTASFGGLSPLTQSVAGFEAMLDGLAFVEEVMSAKNKNGEAEAYVFGRDGNLNPGKRLLTAWARSPIEAVAKLYSHLSNGFGGDERAAFKINIHADGEISMRSLHDWSKHPIKDISARLMDEFDLYLESKSSRDDDMSMDFN